MGVHVTANGNYKLETSGRSVSAVRCYGTFGGGSLVLGFKDCIDGTITAYAENNTAKTAAGEWRIEHGLGQEVYVMVTGATTPSIWLEAFKVD